MSDEPAEETFEEGQHTQPGQPAPAPEPLQQPEPAEGLVSPAGSDEGSFTTVITDTETSPDE